ncbi:MAG: TetR/AcrR family transcriptional regulator [Pseudomonadota bacterium]
MSDRVEQLLDAAEARIRGSGFHAVSFRDLADDLGIKSASVHYHYRRKEDLGAAVVERYQKRVFAMVEARIEAGDTPLAAYCATYRAALAEGDRVCLCGVMGAEMQGLPAPVQEVVRSFMRTNVEWLEGIYTQVGCDDPRARALLTLAALQGAMMLAVSLGDTTTFDRIAAQVACFK